MIAATLQGKGRYVPLLISLYVDDIVQHMGHPDGRTIFTQVAGKQSRVDVIGLGEQAFKITGARLSG